MILWGSSSGKLVTTQIYLTPYHAFVPNPLPPELLFQPETIKLLEQAGRALGELAGLGRMLPNPKLLIRPFISREAVLSSMIEGTVTELQDLYASEATDQPLPGLGANQPPSDDLREVQNYVIAMEYGLDQIQGRTIDISLLCALHERLMKGVQRPEPILDFYTSVRTISVLSRTRLRQLISLRLCRRCANAW